MSEVTQKTNILGFSQAQMEDFFATLGEPKFRATQVLKWIHQFGNYLDASDMSKMKDDSHTQVWEFYIDDIDPNEPVIINFYNYSGWEATFKGKQFAKGSTANRPQVEAKILKKYMAKMR